MSISAAKRRRRSGPAAGGAEPERVAPPSAKRIAEALNAVRTAGGASIRLFETVLRLSRADAESLIDHLLEAGYIDGVPGRLLADAAVILKEAPPAEGDGPGVKQDGPGVKQDGPDVKEDRPAVKAAGPRAPRPDLVLVPIDRIDASHNVRTDLGEEALLLLQESIADVGLLQPVVVRKTPSGLRLVSGHRRLEAARRAGEEYIEARVYVQTDDAWEARARLAENVQRKDLTHIELAGVLGQAADAGLSIAAIAQQAHLSDDSVRRHLALRRLAPPVADLVARGRLPVHQGELIARVGDPARQIELAERAVRLVWTPAKNGAAGRWAAEGGRGGMTGRSGAEDPDARDYIAPMGALRREVAAAMQSLAACGWPMAEPYADRRPCAGCPDNTASYADQPMLFAGIAPRGSARKGHCTHATCYEAKRAAWDRVLATRRRERERAQAKAVTRARKAGLDVCGSCARIAAEGETFRPCDEAGGRICPSCEEKTAKGRGGRAGREPERPFPNSPEERLAVEIAAYAGNVLAAIKDWGAAQDEAGLAPERYLAVMGELLALQAAECRAHAYHDTEVQVYINIPVRPFGELDDIRRRLETAGSEFRDRPGVLTSLADFRFPARPAYERWRKRLVDVPIPPKAVLFLACLEAFCGRHAIAIPERPTKRSLARAGLRERILTIGRDELPAALKDVGREDEEVLRQILGDAEAGRLKRPLAGWRDTAIAGRLAELRGYMGDPREFAAARKAEPGAKAGPAADADDGAIRKMILRGGRAEALNAIDECEDVALLESLIYPPPAAAQMAAWRVNAIGGRIGVLRSTATTALRAQGATEQGEPAAPPGRESPRASGETEEQRAANALRNRIVQGRRAEALAAIAEADEAALSACAAIGLKGDWRRAAVRKRLEQLRAGGAAEDADDDAEWLGDDEGDDDGDEESDT